MSRLRCLSLWRPYAGAVASGLKYVECRDWYSSHLGDLAIHAAKKCAPDGEPVYSHPGIKIGPGGVVVAVVSMIACLKMRYFDPLSVGPLDLTDGIDIFPSRAISIMRRETPTSIIDQTLLGSWSPGMYGFLLDAVRPLREPVPVRGMPGMWTLTDDESDAIREQL